MIIYALQKTNDPADLQPSGGLRSGGPMEAFHARDPHVPNDEIKRNMPLPAVSLTSFETICLSLTGDHFTIEPRGVAG